MMVLPIQYIHSTMVMPSLTLLNINDLPWSISVTWTLCRVEDLESFFPVMYHLHTAVLFTWTDYKTILLPIASLFICCPFTCTP